MVSFAEFAINFMNKFGITWIFSVLLVTFISYLFILLMLKNIAGGNQQQSQYTSLVKIIAGAIAISIGILLGTTPKAYVVIQYFSAFIGALLTIILLLLIVHSFVAGENAKIQNKSPIYIISIILATAFIFTSIYFAYQQEIVQMNQPGGANLAILVFRPEILSILFIFIILGLGIFLTLRETTSGRGSR